MSTKPEVLIVLKKGIRKEPFSYSERREPFAVVRCPDCKGAGPIDLDQWEGKVSIQCDNCNYHETHNMTEVLKNAW